MFFGFDVSVFQIINPNLNLFFADRQGNLIPLFVFVLAVLLGFEVAKTLVLSTSVLGMMSKSMTGLWPHSLACARTCVIIARYLDLDDPEEVSVTGLLHDLGKVVLEAHVNDVFEVVVGVMEDRNIL